MAVLPILQLGDPRLRQVSRPVTAAELATPATQAFIDDLIETMHHAHGAGLAAPQVGDLRRICAVHVRKNPRYPYKPDHPLTVFVNPVIEVVGDAVEWIYEGCLSVPDLRGLVPRHMHVRVTAWDRHGQPMALEARGLSAGTYQHEFDHLDGLLFVDRVADARTLTTWAEFDKHHKAEFVAHAQAINARYLGAPEKNDGPIE
ncbi:MAG: peptide deformylase [Myxococcales bacterium]|nr:peptide deformylase [Myxococcales bacterium]